MTAAQETAKKRRNSWDVCAGAVSEMRTILDELEEYSGVYEETAALRKQLDRIEKACARSRTASRHEGEDADEPETVDEPPSAQTSGDPKTVARRLIAQMPLQMIFQDPALSDAFLSELLLALAKESSGSSRRERQRQGIKRAKANGVRFGAPQRPLPENFEEMHRGWRNGEFSLRVAAKKCGMAETTFYNAVRRAERTAQ